MKGYRHLRYEDRLLLENLLRKGMKKGEIAVCLHCHPNTITNELKRGKYLHRNSDYTEEWRYSPDLAEEKYQQNVSTRGTGLKISNDYDYAEYLEKKIVEEDYSPSAVLGELEKTGKGKEFKTKICVATLYSYIDKGIFFRLSNKDLPVKRKKKRNYRHIKRQKRASAGKSIAKRPKKIENRKEFGHWEMDTVVGKRGVSKNSLLVLTERKTRKEILFKLPNHSACEVVKKLDELERLWKDDFKKVFKSITVDNGTEFSFSEEMEKSVYGGNRTEVYYCHAYSSWERGTNENQNRLVRRKVPKGSNFDHMTDEEVKAVENWMNNYPRKLFGFRTANQEFQKELALVT